MRTTRNAAIIFLILFLAMPVLADFSGTINFSNSGNRSTVSGIWAYTVDLCNSTSQCITAGVGLSCFIDYDNVSTPPSFGWCNATGITSCYHNNSEYATGTSICITNTTYSTCSSGAWPSPSSCSSGQTCPSAYGTPGNCTTASSSSSSGGSSSGSSTVVGSIIFTSYPLGFDIVQGNIEVKYASLKNNGNKTLYNVTLEASGAGWVSVETGRVNRSVINNETTFAITFSPPEDTDVKAYVITLTAKTSDSSVTAANSFGVNVKPSNKTVQEQILPEYGEYTITLGLLEARMNQLESDGADVEEIKGLIANAKSKLADANNSIESEDYFQAKQFLNDAKSVLDAAAEKLNDVTLPEKIQDNYLLFIIIGVVAAIAVVVVYLLLPPKITSAKGWITSSEKKKGLFRKLKRKKGMIE